MKRKIIQQRNSYTITLPKKWIKNNNLTGQDELDIKETENKLEITAQAGKSKKKIMLKIEKYELKALASYIAAAYTQGYNLIEVECDEKIPFTQISSVTDTLVGAIILNQSSNSITVQCATSVHVDIEPLIDKFFVSIGYLFSELKQGTDQNQIKLLGTSLLKLRRYISRLLIISNFGDEKNTEYAILINSLERIANVAEKISRQGKNQETKIPEYFAELQKAYLKRSRKQVLVLSEKLARARNAHDFSNASYAVLLEYLFSATSRVRAILI